MAAQNVAHRVEGNKLVIEVDLKQTHGLSGSGKTMTVASSGGFNKLSGEYGDISFSMNVCKKLPKK